MHTVLTNNFNTDPNRLTQIIVNLVNNAIKFTSEGSVTIKAKYEGLRLARIMVIDTGIGIKEEEKK